MPNVQVGKYDSRSQKLTIEDFCCKCRFITLASFQMVEMHFFSPELSIKFISVPPRLLWSIVIWNVRNLVFLQKVVSHRASPPTSFGTGNSPMQCLLPNVVNMKLIQPLCTVWRTKLQCKSPIYVVMSFSISNSRLTFNSLVFCAVVSVLLIWCLCNRCSGSISGGNEEQP